MFSTTATTQSDFFNEAEVTTTVNELIAAKARSYLSDTAGLDAAAARLYTVAIMDEDDETVCKLDEVLSDLQIYQLAVQIMRVGQDPGVHPGDETAITMAVPLFKVAADRGLADASYTYASLLNMGKGVVKDYNAAAEIFKTLARDGNPHATFNLAGMHLSGNGVGQSTSKAIGLYDVCGNMGVSRGWNAIGLIYFDGKYRGQDFEEAVKWFQKGAGQCEHCNMSLAHMYTYGKGVEENHEQALRHNLKASDGGLVQAQYNVAHAYFTGKGVEKVDLELAAHYYELAARQGFLLAQINLGNMYRNGYGVPQDLEKAKFYYGLSAHVSPDAKGLLEATEEAIQAVAEGRDPDAATAEGNNALYEPPPLQEGGGGGLMSKIKGFFK